MVPSNVKTNAPEDGRDETRVDRMLETAVTLAQQLTQGVGFLAGTAALAGGALWLIVWWPPSVRSGTLLGAGLTLLLLLAPAAVLGLFYAGLRDLSALPDRLSNRISKTTEASVESYRAATDTPNSWWGWGRRLLGQIWALRSLFAEHRTFLMRYGAMLRLLTPGFLFLVVGAAATTFLLVPVTGLVLLFTAFL